MKQVPYLRISSKMVLAGLLTISLQAQQAEALKLTVTRGAPSPVVSKKEAGKREPLPAAVIVEVRDETGKIVPGARVQINTPAAAGKLVVGWTDTEGRAYIDRVVPLGQEGKLPITAEARFSGKSGTTTFNNTAMAPPPPEIARTFTINKPDHKLRNTLIIAGAVGVTALAIALALTLPGGTAKAVIPTVTTAASTSVSLTGITVGAPQ